MIARTRSPISWCAIGAIHLTAIGIAFGAQITDRQISPDSVSAGTQRSHDSYDRASGLPEPNRQDQPPPTAWGQETRSIDGFGNNVANPDWGATGTRLLRLAPPDYADGQSAPAGASRPSPRAISNAICTVKSGSSASATHSDLIWMWGQFLDHDLDLTGSAEPSEPFDIPVPISDPFFDPLSTGNQIIALNRSAYDPTSGLSPDNPREQVNFITAFIDASNVYGSDSARESALRTLDGTGRLKTTPGGLMPFNRNGLPNAGGTGPNLFLAGDVRANEQLALTVLHTLFVREHNRLADAIATQEPGLSGEEIYQRARAIVGAQMQVITYNEWLPLILGNDAIPPYQGYDPAVNPGIANLFANACFRVGHTMLSPQLMRLDENGNEIPQGNLALRDAFFAQSRLVTEGGLEPVLRGGAAQPMQHIDHLIVDEVRNFLFGLPGAGGFDLVSLNIQRGRDHGLPSYNAARAQLGLPPANSFADMTSSPSLQTAFASVYASVDDVDVWIGAISEDHVPGAIVGPLIHAVLADQFTRVRDGDRFWYENYFSGQLLDDIQSTRLSDIIRRNTTIRSEIPRNVFLVARGEVPAASAWGLGVLVLLILCTATAMLRVRKSRLAD